MLGPMIAFGSSITVDDAFEQFAAPGIERVKEPDSVVFARAATGSIFRSYNMLLDLAASRDDLEALVLVHQDAELVDPDTCHKIRQLLRDEDVGVIGLVGAIGVRSIAWWEGSVTWAAFTHRYGELGGGHLPAFSWYRDEMPPYAHTGAVDTVDGFVMILSPWVVRNVRFDESIGALHGYDLDFCLQVREAGKKVVTADIRAIHHHSLDLVSKPDTWVDAHMKIAEKWDTRMPGIGRADGPDWRWRARRAEAEAAVARAQARSMQLKWEAHVRQLESHFEIATTSLSWKITEPLRRLNEARRTLLRRREPAAATRRGAIRAADQP
jgi:GT2 family glycosyltransferase